MIGVRLGRLNKASHHARIACLAAWLAATVGSQLALPATAVARNDRSDIATVRLGELPAEARKTDALIHAGGPFPYPNKDGSVFGNRERQLPARPRGEYREYTVKTPGSRDRGPRRIVCAGRQPTAPDVCYYTGDHYASFQRIVR